MRKKIFISNSARGGKKLAKRLGYSFHQETTIEKYPDTEKVIGIREKIIRRADIIYWQFDNVQNLDDQILNLLAFVDKFSDSRITRLILPYMPYGRAAALADNEVDKLCFLLRNLSAAVKTLHLVVVHHNFEQSTESRTGLKNIFVVEVDDQLVAFLEKKFGKRFVLASPDAGFSATVGRLAKIMNVASLSLTKRRLSPAAVSISSTLKEKKIVLENKNERFIIVDDIVSTGETLSQATKILQGLGVKAKNISYAAVHDTRRGSVSQKIKVFCSNSLLVDHYDFDITDALYDALKTTS
jgi:phosphoribosylpyrophosphate synthetase